MKEWSDEELDELFRKSAEEFEPQYRASDWHDLRRRLDGADGVTGGGWLKNAAPWLMGLLLLLVGGVGGYYYYHTADKKYPVADNKTVSRADDKTTSPSEVPASGRAHSGQAQAESSANPSETPPRAALNGSEPGPAGTEAKSPDRAKREKYQPSASGQREAQNTRQEPNEKIKEKELPRNPVSVSGVRKQTDPSRGRGDGAILLSEKTPAPKLGENLDEIEKTPRPSAAESAAPPTSAGSAGTRAEPEPSSFANSRAGVSRQESDDTALRSEWPALEKLPSRGMPQESTRLAYPAVVYKKNKNSDTAAPARAAAAPLWSVRIGIAPDLSMVRMSEMMNSMRPGPSASLLVDYSLNDRWALQTGVIRSLKSYHAQFDDYNGSEEWGSDPMPASIDGDCRVFELPVNLRYDFGYDLSPRQKARWFLGAGVSSYKMQREKYTYNYPGNYPANVHRKTWTKGRAGIF